MDTLLLDLRYGLRALAARPAFTALAVLTLAIGIGVNTVAFSAVNALIYKPMQFERAEELGWIQIQAPGLLYNQSSWPDFEDLTRANTVFSGLAAHGRYPVSLHGDGGAVQIWSQMISAAYFDILRTRPAIGRLPTPADRASSDVAAVVSYRFWTGRLGGGESVAGRTLTLNGRTVSIVGVLPDNFQGPGGFFEPEVYLPLEQMAALNLPAALGSRTQPWLGIIGRLASGVTVQQANASLQAFATAMAETYPSTHKDRSMSIAPMNEGNPEMQRLAPSLWIALAIVGLVLLIACFNVAGLLLARASERQREISVRCALGAGRRRILRQLVTEGMLLAACSGVAALVLAVWSADLLSAFSLPSPIPQRLHIPIDRRLVLFTAALVTIAGVLPAVVPALQATRADLLRAIKLDSSGGGRSSRARNGFVLAQVAGSTLFLAAALLFVRSFLNTTSFSPGFDTTRLLVMEIQPSTYGYDDQRSRGLLTSLVDRLRELPGVEHAAIADRIPFYVGFTRTADVSADGASCAAGECGKANVYSVGRGHFAALGVALREGRDFTEQEALHGGSAIVSRTLAARLWPGRSAVGQWIREGTGSGTHLMQVVGVAADITHRRFDEPPAAYLYRPLAAQDFAGAVTVIVRTTGDPRLLVAPVQAQLVAVDRNLPAASLKTMAQRMEMPLWPARTGARFFGVTGTLALILTTVGLFGVTYFAVSRRTREFGVRIALGATPRTVIALVLREGLSVTLPGIALGLAGAVLAGRLAASVLFGVSPYDPASYAGAAVLQIAIALGACALPAYRATRVDPIAALRVE